MDLTTVSKNLILDFFSAEFNGGYLEVRSGASPGSNLAATGTLLATANFAATAFAAAAAGSIVANAIASDTSIDATDAIGYVRAFTSTDVVKGDFTVSLVGDGGEFQFDSLNVEAGKTLNVTAGNLFM